MQIYVHSVLSKLELESFTHSTTMCNESSCFSMSKEENTIIDLISHYLPTIQKVPSLCHCKYVKIAQIERQNK